MPVRPSSWKINRMVHRVKTYYSSQELQSWPVVRFLFTVALFGLCVVCMRSYTERLRSGHRLYSGAVVSGRKVSETLKGLTEMPEPPKPSEAQGYFVGRIKRAGAKQGKRKRPTADNVLTERAVEDNYQDVPVAQRFPMPASTPAAWELNVPTITLPPENEKGNFASMPRQRATEKKKPPVGVSEDSSVWNEDRSIV